MRMATHIFLKLNQSPNIIQSPSSSPPPNDTIFNQILMQLTEWLTFLSNLIHEALPFALAALGVVALCLFCFCCFPAIISCVAWLACACCNCIKGLLRCVCCCCQSRPVGAMMRAPGRAGVYILRSAFESNPQAYFAGLRGGLLA